MICIDPKEKRNKLILYFISFKLSIQKGQKSKKSKIVLLKSKYFSWING